ncbi:MULTISPECIES: DMT family transporter [Eisenbergiella]|uniref:DMT family transporter n=1 Tax=Eisenbergiella TaxID=1432051 RepID=UPI0023F0A65D|nr:MULTISPECIES: DMT family transporter [Eisenbergiella]MCI6706023.1 DMT family transporter [Eisenbergiella massiliensis]MDY5524600.1 DMT family transporter [Eisenbergiella porci]
MNQNGESSRGGQIGHGRDHSYRSSLLLFLAASIWGVAFVAQSVGMDYMGPFTFNGARSLIGGTVLLPLIVFREQKQKKAETRKETAEERKQRRKITLIGGVCWNILAICTASMFQQIGIQYTTVGKAGFITTLYIIIVPIMGLFFGKKVRRIVWAGAAIAAAGMYLLCVNETLSLNRGDVLVFICAVIFSIHILVIDYFSPKTDGVKLSCIQFFVAGIICTIGAFLFEEPTWSGLVSGAVPVLYAGVMSCGVAYTLQIIGQKHLDPTVASLILSLESVVSVLAGWVILGETLNLKEIFGCVLVFAAVILVQLPEKAGEAALMSGADS